METLIARASGVVGEENLGASMVTVKDNSAIRRKMMDIILEKYPDSAMGWYISGWWQYLNANDVEAATKEFKKALELDPLHARIVEGCWQFFQIAADEEMVAMLYERLKQIAPEKGSEQHLGKVSLLRKQEALEFQLAITADPSLIESMEAMLSSPEYDSLDFIDALSMSVRILEIKNDQAGMAELPLASLLQEEHIINKDAPSGTRHRYISLLGDLLGQDQNSGVPEKASQTAGLILQILEDIPHCEHVDLLRTRAYITLGQQDKAWVVVNKMLDVQQGTLYFEASMALAMLDADQAAERMLETHKLYPSWNGMDYMAIFHFAWRDMLVHPDIQAYFVKEGKWVDYLAERVPEYAQYRK